MLSKKALPEFGNIPKSIGTKKVWDPWSEVASISTNAGPGEALDAISKETVVEFVPPVPTTIVVLAAETPSKLDVTPGGNPNTVKVTFPALEPESAFTVTFVELVVTPGNAASRYCGFAVTVNKSSEPVTNISLKAQMNWASQISTSQCPADKEGIARLTE